MKIEIEKREYDRLKSREEKLLAYYEWWREWEWMDLNTIEEVINDNIRLREENKKLKEENVLLKWCLDKLMFDTDVVNVKIHWELWDYCYVRSDKKFKLNVKD